MEVERQVTGERDAERMVLALRASNEGIWDWWVGRLEIYYSRRILEFLECGSRRAPNLFAEGHEGVWDEDRERFRRVVAAALASGGPELLAVDARVVTGSGGYRWLRIRGTVVRDREGRAVRVAGSMIDISRRKAAEAQVEEERLLLRTLIDHVPLQVYFKDRESRFVLANRKMADWIGVESPADLVGRHDRDFFRSEHAALAEEDERRIMETGVPVTGKLERETWRGEEDTWVVTSKFPWCGANGELRGTFGVSSDVTELVQAQRAAMELAVELQERHRAHEDEVKLAWEVQQALAGSPLPAGGDEEWKFAARYRPISGLAGDFYEVRRLAPGVQAVLVCDVMGHGMRAALVVAMLRGLLEQQRGLAAEPAVFLEGLNRGLVAILKRAETTLFATAFYAVWDEVEGELRYACAGHPGALMACGGEVKRLAEVKDERGPGLGLIEGASFPEGRAELCGCSRLLMYTDGILEAESPGGELLGIERLKEWFGEVAELPIEEGLQVLLERVLGYAGGERFGDDVCAVMAGRGG